MNQQKSTRKISREEIRRVYAQEKEAVIALVEGLLKRIEELELLEVRVEALEYPLSKNSRNSNKSASGGGFGKRTKSLQSQSERPSEGQAEHPGTTLDWSDKVDWVVKHRGQQCQGCEASLADQPVERIMARQVG